MDVSNSAYLHSDIFAVVAGIFGLLIGSFLNVVIYRLPIMLIEAERQACHNVLDFSVHQPKTQINLWALRSFCPHCKSTLPTRANIPILSYIALCGRSLCCQTKIASQYLIVEFFACLLTVMLAFHFGLTLQFFSSLLLIYALLALFFIDLNTQLLPDQITLPLIWLGLLFNSYGLYIDVENAIIGAMSGYLFFYIVSWSVLKLRKIEGLGRGDCKLLALFGAWFGWQMLLPTVFIASFMGAIVTFIYLILSKKPFTTPIAFGPFLALGGVLVLFWGQHLFDYLSYFTRHV